MTVETPTLSREQASHCISTLVFSRIRIGHGVRSSSERQSREKKDSSAGISGVFRSIPNEILNKNRQLGNGLKQWPGRNSPLRIMEKLSMMESSFASEFSNDPCNTDLLSSLDWSISSSLVQSRRFMWLAVQWNYARTSVSFKTLHALTVWAKAKFFKRLIYSISKIFYKWPFVFHFPLPFIFYLFLSL